MKIISPFLLLTFLYSGAWSQEKKADDSPDSTQSLILTINGKDYVVKEKEKITLNGSFNNPVLSVRTQPFKKFNSGTLSFDYPKHMSLALSESTGLKNWTFSGNDFIIMYFEIGPKTPLDLLISGIVEKFGADNCKIEPIQRSLGGKTLSGKRINVSLAQQKLTQDFLQITLADGVTRIIAFQDSINDSGMHSAESKAAIELIDATMKFN